MSDKDERPWIKLALDYFDNPKIDALSDTAQLMHIQLIMRAARMQSDGNVSVRAAKARGDAAFKELVAGGLLLKVDANTYRIHDYLKHQTTADKIAEKAQKRAFAGSLGGHKKNHENRLKFDESCEHCRNAFQSGAEWLKHNDLEASP